MHLSRLLQATARRYQAAAQRVLTDWQPECSCDRPGSHPHCESCPCLMEFERRVRHTIIHLVPEERVDER